MGFKLPVGDAIKSYSIDSILECDFEYRRFDMLEAMYGSLKIRKKIDFLLLPIKIIYIVYTIPFLLFVLLMQIKTFIAFGNPLKEKVGTVKAILITPINSQKTKSALDTISAKI